MDIIRERMTAAAPEGVVLFLIGARINRLWKPWKWLPVARAMTRMLHELDADPALGLLHTRGHFSLRAPFLVQYWQSLDLLLDFANRRDLTHRPAWSEFYRAIGKSGDVGIWHETYAIPPGASETIYLSMPPFGLGAAMPLHPIAGSRHTALGRMTAVGQPAG